MFRLALAAAVAVGTANAQWCDDCKWGVNKLVTYVEQNGDNAACDWIVGEVQSYTADLCNEMDECTSYVSSMCHRVLSQLQSDVGSELSSDGIDATSICAAVDMCSTSSSDSSGSNDGGSDDDGSDDDDRRVRRSAFCRQQCASYPHPDRCAAACDRYMGAGRTKMATTKAVDGPYAQRFCSSECASYPHPSDCERACVIDVSNGAEQFKQAATVQMQADAAHNPLLTLATGQTGTCMADSGGGKHFLCTIDHSTELARASSGSSSSSSNSNASTTGIIVGVVGAVLIIGVIAFKAHSENKKIAAASASTPALLEDEDYATA